MTVNEAIERADALRSNTLPDEQKAKWLHDVDAKLSEIMGVNNPDKEWPEDQELLMPEPCDDIYHLYLVAMIDYYNMELAQYANDIELYNAAMAEALGWWRRNHRPPRGRNWRVM